LTKKINNNLKKKGEHYAKSERIKKKLEEIEKRKKQNGSRKEKKLKKYSQKFNEIFCFFLKSYRNGILTFCGTEVIVKFNINKNDGKYSFRQFENGDIKKENLESKHSNILKAVIIGKKSWGLWIKQWSQGIREGSFRKQEILNEFNKNNIKIPPPLLKEFENLIY